MKAYFIVLMSLMLSNCSAQPQTVTGELASIKVDSAFNYYFELIDLEVNKTPFEESRRTYYYSAMIDSIEVFLLKDVSEAANVLAELSEIKIPYSDNSEDMLITPEISKLWKQWYVVNKGKIVWSKKKDLPVFTK